MKNNIFRFCSLLNILTIMALISSIFLLVSCKQTWIEKTTSVPAFYRQLPYNGLPYSWIFGVILFFIFACIFGGAASQRSVNYLLRFVVLVFPIITLFPLFTETRFFVRHHVFSNMIEVANAVTAPGWWISLCLAICLVLLLEVILFLLVPNKLAKPE